MEFTGKELNNNTLQSKTATTDIQINKLDNMNVLETITPKGDHIKMLISGTYRAAQTTTSRQLWETESESYILLPEERIVYFPPNIFWNFYKKYPRGREMMKGTCSKLFINEIPYHFPDTSFYFSNQISELTTSGVYGIYLDDSLLYIGSSSDIMTRWKQHDTNFRNQSPMSTMYHQGFDPDQIVYKVLLTREQIQTMLGIKNPSMWLVELAEFCYISALQPTYNIEGKTKVFSFRARPQPADFPPSYWEVAKNLLLFADSDIGRYTENDTATQV